MRIKGILFFALMGTSAFPQHRIYLNDGSKIEGKVIEISPTKITAIRHEKYEFIDPKRVVLIDYGKGRTDVFVEVKKDIHIKNEDVDAKVKVQNSDFTSQNEVYVNTLALVNSDISVFYEHRKKNGKLGLGIMGAYNFNAYANTSNLFIAVLNNGKKLHDAGAYINFYSGLHPSSLSVYYSVMLKYTDFIYSEVHEDTTFVNGIPSVQISYSEGKGHQLASIFSIGFHKQYTDNFFIKGSIGLGAFRLKGEYKEQFNYVWNNGNTNSADAVEISILPKAYLNFAAGWNF